MNHDSIRDINDWNHIAEFWDEQVADGSDFQRSLVFPATDQLLIPATDQTILDCCCGNGNYARRLARLGCEVVAFDGSVRMIELAKARSDGLAIDYHTLDATDEMAMQQGLGGLTFDAAVCSMAMMDLPTIAPLLASVRRLLKPAGRFVFSVGHPSFHTNEAQMLAVQDHGQGTPTQEFSVLVKRYLSDWPHQSRGLLDQPRPHTIYHRSLTSLLAECFKAGFVVTGLLEPAFDPETRLRSPFSWARRPEIPPVLVVRLS